MFSKSYAFTFGRKLFFSVFGLFFIFVTFSIIYQYHREKEFRIELIGNRILNYNDIIFQEYKDNPEINLTTYIQYLDIENIHVTIINLDGSVVADSYLHDSLGEKNISDRPEIQQALVKGTGISARRMSETIGLEYFYAASRFNNCIIRTGIPYNDSLIEVMKTNTRYAWFALGISVILIFIFYKVVNNIGTAINQLRQFAFHVDRNEPYESLIESISGNNELAEISQHIIGIYQRLHETKEALSLEREKLIAHLQTSHEGLGVFTSDRKEILVNPLFIRYINAISDNNIEKSDEIFDIPELQPLISFIEKVKKRPVGAEGKRKDISIHKNGLIFTAECILFHDLSFEISINDVTREEEQSILKRQLTQNIAHELKTPVSSIQGYLETIVNNPAIPPEKEKLFLKRCYEQSNRLTELLRDISVLTRMEEATDMLEIETVDITAMVNSIINEMALELEKKNISVTTNLKEKLEIRGNYSLLYSIFRNLMDNSLAYAGTDIQIKINNFREDNNLLYFSFSDNGVGVSPEHLQRLFERFYRIDKGRSRKLGGTGLGLAIVKNAVLIHGGTIFAKKVLEGGLEFIFTLAKER